MSEAIKQSERMEFNMILLVMGGSGSGKSEYAEGCAKSIRDNGRLYYLATMEVYGDEGKEKVKRHRKLREGKGFITIEQTKEIARLTEKYEFDNIGDTILLECISNLVANEMFGKEGVNSPEEVVKKVVSDVCALSLKVADMVIVTNNIFEEIPSENEQTLGYIRALAKVNEELAKLADKTVEVVAGIPVPLEKGKGCLY